MKIKKVYFSLIPLIFILPFIFITSSNKPETIFVSESNKSIGLYPLGNFDSSLLLFLKKEISDFYSFPVVILNGSDLPSKAYYKSRNRYRADTLLDYLLVKRPKNIDYIVGLTEKDISCTKGKYIDWGVFGLGYLPGKISVISIFRLKPSAKNFQHFQERLSKVVIHELGHNFGLDHCINKHCIMRDAEGTIKSVDNEQKALCEECKRKLKIFMK